MLKNFERFRERHRPWCCQLVHARVKDSLTRKRLIFGIIPWESRYQRRDHLDGVVEETERCLATRPQDDAGGLPPSLLQIFKTAAFKLWASSVTRPPGPGRSLEDHAKDIGLDESMTWLMMKGLLKQPLCFLYPLRDLLILIHALLSGLEKIKVGLRARIFSLSVFQNRSSPPRQR